MTEQELTDLFHRLGARDPELWARSQVDEGIPQLARFVFLKKAWKLVVDDSNSTWIQEGLALDPSRPGGSIPLALQRLVALGATPSDLTSLVRVMQWRVLAGLCELLDSSGGDDPLTKAVSWQLFQTDETGAAIAAMTGLHESVLETEPSGREMRN